jgi:protein TonB
MPEALQKRPNTLEMPPDLETSTASEPEGLPAAARRVSLPALAEPHDGGGPTMRAAATVVSVLFSLLLHGSVAAAMVLWFEPRPGAIPLPTEAISIELVTSEVLEAIQPSPSQEAAASRSSVQSEAGSEREAPAASQPMETEPSAPVMEDAAKEETIARIDEAPSVPPELQPEVSDEPAWVEHQQAPPEIEKSEPPRAKPESEVKSPVKERTKEPTRAKKARSEPRRKGGAPSRAMSGAARSSSISASTGSAINYAALVRAHVAARRPPGTGLHGTVVVTFGVSRSGGLSYARIARSSGDVGLDRNVLSAVRGAAPFPTPPPGASPVQMGFTMPFYFRSENGR